MYYVCVENGLIVSVLNHEPQVPPQVQVYEMSDSDHALIVAGSHYFDVLHQRVQPMPPHVSQRQHVLKHNEHLKKLLSDTDWQVLRHHREKALGLATTLSEHKYLQLERKRQEWAQGIQPDPDSASS
jgi:hypothetical protein